MVVVVVVLRDVLWEILGPSGGGGEVSGLPSF